MISSIWTNSNETLYELSSSGRSGALFYYTKDRKYMLKSIAAREFYKLQAILADYVDHISRNPDTLMTKFFGMYMLEWKNPDDQGCFGGKTTRIHIIVMDNLFKVFDAGIRFDLKGSFINRTRLTGDQTIYTGRDINVSLKDNDFRAHMQTIKFVECFKPNMPPLHEILESDVEFLTRNNLIDYSFLLGELKQTADEVRECVKEDINSGRGIYLDSMNRVWLCGFIDPLNDYDYTKKFEYCVKGLKHGTRMSCVPPAIYS